MGYMILLLVTGAVFIWRFATKRVAPWVRTWCRRMVD